MNIRLLPALLLFCCAMTLSAQIRHLTTDKSPSAVFADPDSRHIHVLTAGVDVNFNGAFEPDSGDVAPRWFVIDSYNDALVDSVTFEGFFNSFPIRVGVDEDNKILYLPQLGRVRSFNLTTRELLRDTVALGNYSGISFDPISGALICHDRTDFTSRGHIVGILPETGDTLGVYPAGFNPQMSISLFDGITLGPAVYTLNEGTYTKPDASITYASGNNDIYKAKNNRPLGGGASYITTRGTLAFVVLNGTHQIRMIDTKQHKELPLSPINVGTSGFDGPRSLAFQTDEVVLVPTYAGDLRRFITLTGKMFDSIPLPGKGEAVAVRDSLAFVAIKYGLGGTGYDPDSIVAVVGLNSATVINTIPVGLDPGALFIDKRGDLHVLGYGPDDTTHWWMVFDGSTFERKNSRRLSGKLGFPLRVAYDESRDSLYMVLSDSLLGFSAAHPEAASRFVYADLTAAGELSGATLAGDGDILITELPRNFSPDPGFVHVVGLSDGKRIAKFRAGSFVTGAVEIQSEREHARAFYALNEGTFGSPSSTLSLFQYSPNILGGDSLGKGANHLTTIDGYLLATMNGDHQLVSIEPDSWMVNERIPTGTSGFDGPRETIEAWIVPIKYLAVTTYAGDLRIMRHDGEIVETYQTGGKAEGAIQLNDKYYVANTLTPDYAADSTVAIISAPASVERVSEASAAMLLEQNYPNPAGSHTSIGFTVHERGYVELSLLNLRGELVSRIMSSEMDAGNYRADLETAGLPAGRYIYTLREGDRVESKVMEVVR